MGGSSQKVLAVDDDARILELIKYNLSKRGYEVITASNGEDGLAKAEALPDVILLDIKMPGMDGYETARRLKSSDKTKNIPIIMTTGRGEAEAVEKAFASGASDYIVKPFVPTILVEKVRNALGG